MKVRAKTITVYITSDGQDFTDYKKATIHELELIIEKFHYSGIEAADIASHLFDEFDAISKVVKTYIKIDSQLGGRKPKEEEASKAEPDDAETMRKANALPETN